MKAYVVGKGFAADSITIGKTEFAVWASTVVGADYDAGSDSCSKNLVCAAGAATSSLDGTAIFEPTSKRTFAPAVVLVAHE